MKLIIVIGLMGCGKTTFAKEFAEKFNYEYIDFDFEFHTKINKRGNPKNKKELLNNVAKLFENIRALLNNNSSKNFIIDGWFKWHANWWQDDLDDTLRKLQENLKFHNIEVLYFCLPFKETYKRYAKKHKEDIKHEFGGIQKDYKETMEQRQRCLNKKIFKWVTQ